MDWKVKAFVQQIFSHLPGGDRLNYFAQKSILKNLPVSDELFLEKIREAKRHLDAFLKYSVIKDLGSANFQEFGTGWDMIIPVSYYCMGVNEQMLTDVAPLLKQELIKDTVVRIQSLNGDVKSLLQRKIPERLLSVNLPQTVLNFKHNMGIVYEAPVDSRDTNLANDAFDFISSTNTLEHVPKRQVLQLLQECYRILKKGGVMNVRIDYQDHYAYVDSSISVYNFLKFSDAQWNWLNPSLQHQNRLRHSDFVRIMEKSLFDIVEINEYKPTEEDMNTISKLSLSKRFQEYQPEQLAVRWAYITLRK